MLPLLKVLAILQKVTAHYRIDPDRIYVTGQSMGGYATWALLVHRPDLFAVAVPICGGGDPAIAESIKHLPIWNFHGAQDKTVPVTQSRIMVEALQAVNGRIQYTEYENTGHNCWEKAWSTQELIDWLF